MYYLKSNITTENIALHFKSDIMPILFTEIHSIYLEFKLFETPNVVEV